MQPKSSGLWVAFVGPLFFLTACLSSMPIMTQEHSDWLSSLEGRTEEAASEKPLSSQASLSCLSSEQELITQALLFQSEPFRLEGRANMLLAESQAAFYKPLRLRFDQRVPDSIGSNARTADVTVRIPFLRPGDVDGPTLILQQQAEEARAEAQFSRVEVVRQAKRAYAAFFHTRSLLELAEAAEIRHRPDGNGAAPQPLMTEIERMRGSAEQAVLASERMELEDEVERWKAYLHSISGQPLCEELRSPYELSKILHTARSYLYNEKGESVESALVELALKEHPELKQLFSREKQAALQEELAFRRSWPWFDWFQYTQEFRQAPAPSSAELSLALAIPIHTWFYPEIEAHVLRQESLQQEARMKVEEIKTEIRSLSERLSKQVRTLEALDHLATVDRLSQLQELSAQAPGEILSKDIDSFHKSHAKLLERRSKAVLRLLETQAELCAAFACTNDSLTPFNAGI